MAAAPQIDFDEENLPSQTDTDDEEDQQDQEEQQSDDPLANQEELQKALYDLYIACCGDDRYARLIEVKDVKQAEFYWGGRQYIWWSKQDRSWQLPSQAQAINYGDLDLDDMPKFEFVTNIYQARGLMVIGAVASAPPRIRFFPQDADNADDIETADGRTKLTKLIERWNPVAPQLQDEVYHAWTGGVVVYHTRYVSDNDNEEGLDSLPEMREELEPVESHVICPNCGWSAPADHAVPPFPCPNCSYQLTDEDIAESEPIPVPAENGEAGNNEGRQLIDIYGALNFKRPQHVQTQAQFHYCAIEEEIHYTVLRDAFPSKADKITPGLGFDGEDAFERNARLSVSENTRLLTQTGSAQSSLCTFARIWFRRSAFRMCENKENRQKLIEIFPNGCRVEFAGSVYCKSEAQSMDECLVVKHIMPGRGQHRNGIGTSMISVQDRENTMANITMETYEYGIPITYRDSSTFAQEADEDQRAAPGLEVEVHLQKGDNIQNKIMQVRADSVSPDMTQHAAALMGPVSDQLTGTYPALSGAGGMEQPETLGQQAMQRDQAMGRMGIYYVNLRQARADIMTLACRDLERHSEGKKIKFPVLGDSGDFESQSVDVAALEGEATAYPEGDENFPELWNQQRATAMQVIDSPQGAILTQDPENAEIFSKLLGIPGLKIPGKDARQKQLREIEEIIKATQQEGGAPEAGPPLIEVDKETDEHPVEAATCKWFLNSLRGQRLKRENPEAWQLIKQHMMQHLSFIPPPATPEKPIGRNVTANFKDMPPEAQAQWLTKEIGIQVNPQDFVMQALAEHVKSGKSTPATGQPVPAPPVIPSGAERANLAV